MSECGNNWNVCLREAPLDERVLVIQERFLEPRTIHMNPHEIEWECLKKVPSQIFPMGIPPILQADHIIHLRRAVANIRITPTNVPSPEEGVLPRERPRYTSTLDYIDQRVYRIQIDRLYG
jgi:hypothetical protein